MKRKVSLFFYWILFFSCSSNEIFWSSKFNTDFGISAFTVSKIEKIITVEATNQGILKELSGLLFFDSQSGKQINSIKTLKNSFAINGTVLYFIPDESNQILAVDIYNDNIIWKKELSLFYNSQWNINVVYYKNRLFVARKPYEKTFCLDSNTGEVLWTLPYGFDRQLIDFDDNRFFLARMGGFELYSIDVKTGKTLWKSSGNDKTFSYLKHWGNSLIGVSKNPETGIISYNLLEKKYGWNYKPFTLFSRFPKFENGITYLQGKDSFIALNLSDGQVLWENFDLNTMNSLSYLIDQDLMYPLENHSNFNIIIFQIDKLTGKTKQKIKVNHPVHSTIDYENGILYYISGDEIFAEKLVDGK